MKRMLLFISALAFASGRADARKPAFDSAARKTLESQYSSYRSAMMRCDTPAIMRLLTKDFTWHMLDGKVLDRRQTQEELRSYFHTVKRIEGMTITLHEVSVQGNTAMTLVTEKVTALIQEHKKESRTTTTERYREYWLKTPYGWKIQRTRLLKS